MKPSLLIIGICLMLGAFTGCSLAPAYHRPAVPVPAQWPDQPDVSEISPAADLDWQHFVVHSPLRRIVTIALENNRNLRQTLLKIEAVRARYRITRSDQWPGISGRASDTRERLPHDVSGTGTAATRSTYQVDLGLNSFEMDLFGRVKSLSEAALQTWLSQEMTARAGRISLIAEVINAYISRNGAKAEYDLIARTLATREISLELIEKQRRYGAGSELDFQEALGLAERARARLEKAARSLAVAGNSLALLTGLSIEKLPEPGIGLFPVQQDLTPGLPSNLIARRPDILAAEHELMARHAGIGAARAAFFPEISLTGFLGSASTELAGLFESGSMSWNYSPRLTVPLFDAGRNRGGLDLALVRKEMAVAKYEYAIQTAFREVADALAVRNTLKREEIFRTALAETSAESLRLSQARYQHGADSHLRYLDAQRSDLSNQIILIQTRTRYQMALVNLFKALGGGWTCSRHREPASKVVVLETPASGSGL